MTEEALYQVEEAGLLPVMTLNDPEAAVETARALVKGGLAVAEVTLRTPRALLCLARIARLVPEMTIGVGTLRLPSQVEQAQQAGAQFAVAPGLNPELMIVAKAAGLPLVPGVATPSEVESALGFGAALLKLFPAELMGGAAMVRALAGPFPEARFLATGGIARSSLGSYLGQPGCAAVGCSWLTPPDAIREGDFDRISEIAADAVACVRAARSKESL